MNYLFILTSVSLTALAQIALRFAMTRPAMTQALEEGGLAIVLAVIRSPYIILGLGAFGLGLMIWLYVLSRIPVSFAYPFVSLGIVLTTVAGALVLGERLSLVSCIGIFMIVAGIGVVALGRG